MPSETQACPEFKPTHDPTDISLGDLQSTQCQLNARDVMGEADLESTDTLAFAGPDAILEYLRGMGRKRLSIMGAGLAALIFLLWVGPLKALVILALVVWVPLGLVALMGPSVVWARVVRLTPRLADRLRRRADTLAVHYDALLDRLPGDWTKSLYLPDLSQPIQVDARGRGPHKPV